jgi:hypothetical protein
MKKLLGVAILSMGLLAPTVATLQAQDHRHEWNDGEKDAWGRYLKERHRKDHDWEHASKKERADYWKWRDAHR